MVPAGCDRWRAEREEEGREEGRESFLCLHMDFILLFLGNDFVTFCHVRTVEEETVSTCWLYQQCATVVCGCEVWS